MHSRDVHGDGDGSQCCGFAARIETNVVGLPAAGMENILQDSHRNVVVFDFYRASAPTSESTWNHFFNISK